MFGLMRAKTCGLTAEEKNFRRLNYCGTCKTIGAVYSQKSRLLLNHDTVFLAEFLSSLSGENTQDWQASFQSYNCLSLPKSDIPISLEFAAAANIVLTEFKIADQVSDEQSSTHRFAQKVFSKDFLTARNILNNLDFPLSEIENLLKSQEEIEKSGKDLEEFAFPTAQTTAIFFREGVRLVGKEELSEKAFALGFEFGKLIYLLDAFEDYEKDFRRNRFNAFRQSFVLKTATPDVESKRKITAILRESENRIIEILAEIPIPENRKNIFVARLAQNLQKKLQTRLPVLKTVCRPKSKLNFAQKWENAKATAQSFARNYSWQMPLVFLFVFVFALVAPAQSREAKSARECFDLSFNLMFLGAIFGSIIAFPKGVLMPMPGVRRQKKPPEEQSSWCDYCDCCDCCDCDCGEGCCDGCNCCDGCDCCSCDCGS